MAITLASRTHTKIILLNQRRSHPATQLSRATNVIIAAIVVSGFILLVVLAWKVRVWRQKRGASRINNQKRPAQVKNEGDDIEKNKNSLPQTSDLARWIPQADSTPSPIQIPAAALLKPSPSRPVSIVVVANRSSTLSTGTPPPAYAFSGPSSTPASPLALKYTFPPPDPPSPFIPPVPDTPLARAITPVSFSEDIAPALASPTFSFSSGFNSQRVSIILQSGDKTFPRTMHVVNDFLPTLPDELAVDVGDVVQILDEYTDGWCMIQLLGPVNTAKGVIPRCCIKDPPEVPRSPGAGQSSRRAAQLMTTFA